MNILVYNAYHDHPAVQHNLNSLINALSNLGHRVYTCDFDDVNSISSCVNLLLQSNVIDFSLAYNFMPIDKLTVNTATQEDVRLHEQIDIPHVSIMLDQPFNPCSGYLKTAFPKQIITYLDRSDELYIDRCCSVQSEQHKIFMPLAGTINDNFPNITTTQRKYDILFSSSSWNPIRIWHDNKYDYPKYIRRYMDEIAELMMYYPCNVKDACITVLHSHGFFDDEYYQKMSPYFWPILRFVKPMRKIETLKHLTNLGLKVDVIGNGFENQSFANKLICHGRKEYEEMLDYVSQSKVVITDMAGFNEGAHDRVFTGMLNGAVVVSEYSSYLDEVFVNNQDLFMFDWQNTEQQMEVIEKLISDEDYRLSIAQNAYNKAIREHTWESRANQILEAVCIIYGLSD